MANDALNEAPSRHHQERLTPTQLFTKTQVNVNSKHWMPFGCPVYVLDNALQGGSGIHHKWKERARVGIYIGRSPLHGRNVANVLSRTTGLVSPQFHVTFDPSFHTVKQDDYDASWQIKAGFVNQRGEAIKSTTKRAMADPEGARRRKKRKPQQESDGVEIDSRTNAGSQLQHADEISPNPNEREIPSPLNNKGHEF